MPEWIDGVAYEGDTAAASDKHVREARIRPGTVNIDAAAFYECNQLVSVSFPDSLRGIGDWAFAGCKRLRSVIIPAGVQSIGRRAFEGCAALNDTALHH